MICERERFGSGSGSPSPPRLEEENNKENRHEKYDSKASGQERLRGLRCGKRERKSRCGSVLGVATRSGDEIAASDVGTWRRFAVGSWIGGVGKQWRGGVDLGVAIMVKSSAGGWRSWSRNSHG